MNKFWGSKVHHGVCSEQCYITYLKVAKKVDLKRSHHK